MLLVSFQEVIIQEAAPTPIMSRETSKGSDDDVKKPKWPNSSSLIPERLDESNQGAITSVPNPLNIVTTTPEGKLCGYYILLLNIQNCHKYRHKVGCELTKSFYTRKDICINYLISVNHFIY